MPKNNYILVGAGVLIAASAAAYVLLSRKKKPVPAGDQPEIDQSGQEITVDQKKLPATLAAILKLPLASINTGLKGKTIKTKLSDVNARLDPYVNNGLIDNVVGTIGKTGTVLGQVTSVVEDTSGSTNADGRKYYWFRVDSPSADAVSQMEETSSWLKGYNKNRTIYLREDTITL
jgi:hypothetical protein